jgi:hypothetical protein
MLKYNININKMKNIFSYSKFVYQTSPDRPSSRPPEGPASALTDRADASKDYVAQQKAEKERLIAMRSKNKDTLYQQWVNNNEKREQKEVLDDPRYLAMKEIPENMNEVKNEAAALLHMFEKFLGTRKETLEIYKKCWKGNKFDIDVLRKQFTSDKTKGKMGFYYGTRKVKWVETFWRGTGEYGPETKTFTGWWAYDNNEKNKTNIKSSSLDADFFRKAGYGDEWLGKTFKEAVNSKTFQTEINPKATENRDNELNPTEEQNVLNEVAIAQKFNSANIYKDKVKKELYESFIKQVPNKWFALPETEDMQGKMLFAYGNSGGSPTDFLYRYSPDKKRIYFIRIDGRNVSAGNFAGYIDLDEQSTPKTLKDWHGLNQVAAEKELKGLIDETKDAPMVKELIDSGKKVEGVSELSRTVGMLETLPAFRKGIAHDKLETDFYDPIRKSLDTKLEKEGIKTKEERNKFIEARIQDIKIKFSKYIEQNSWLKSAIDEKADTPLAIEISSDGEIKKIELVDKDQKSKWQKARDAAKKVKDTVESKIADVYDQVQTRVKQMFKGAAPIVMLLLNSIFKLKDEIKEMLTGGKKGGFSVAGIALGFLGVRTGARYFAAERIDQKGLESIIEPNKNQKVLSKDVVFAENVKVPANYTITIPKGEGIEFVGRKMEVKINGNKTSINKKGPGKGKSEEEGGGGGLEKVGSLLEGGSGGDKFVYKNHEMVFDKGMVIPKGTVLPNKTVIKKV